MNDRNSQAASLFIGCVVVGLFCSHPAFAEMTVDGRAILFYTDDVGIFSATRRLSHDGDPTQPALDTRLTDKGSAVVFEPDLTVGKSFSNPLGTTELSIRGQGFIYTDQTKFSHGTLRIQAVQGLSETTRVRLRYYMPPTSFWARMRIGIPDPMD